MGTKTRLFVYACILSSAFAFSKDYVSDVRQNYEEKSNSELVNQMAAFQRASLVYMAYASYFDRSNVNLPGFKKFFKAASEASLKDAQKVIDYINVRGGHQQFPLIDMNTACKMMNVPNAPKGDDNKAQICQQVMKRDPLKDKKKSSYYSYFFGIAQSETQQSTEESWKNGLKGLNDALLMERHLNNLLLELAKGASQRKDRHLRHVVEDSFLTQQAVRIKKLADVITRLRQHSEQEYPLGEYVIDLEMSG